MGKISWHPCSSDNLRDYSLADVSQHCERNDRWIIIDDFVLDVSSWARKHPGGEKIISSYAGQDASEAWYAFHINKPLVGKYMKSLIIGKLKKNVGPDLSSAKEGLLKDFREIRKSAEDAGLFRPCKTFYAFVMAHILMFEFLGWWTMHQFGISWVPYIIASCFLTIAQIQAGWAQHDYGHLSVFWNSNLNHITQTFLLNFIKGASSDWWNFRHLNHHAKPNVLDKDPDVTLAPLFLIGKTVPTEYGKKKKKYLPYNLQHKYFHFVLPPFLLPLYFNIEIPYFLVKRRKWMEIFWTSMFFVRWQLMFGSMLGFFGVFYLFLFVRMLESHWFVWATQMSHIPMLVDYDNSHDWVTAQLVASCNIERSLFNDWWSGHLNFQIEHHLFPTMPRHNLVKVSSQVRALCDKHNLSYQVKPLWKAFSDIVSLESISAANEFFRDAGFIKNID